MKIIKKRASIKNSTLIEINDFRQKSTVIIETLVKPQVEFALKNSVQFTNSQKAHSNCTIHI